MSFSDSTYYEIFSRVSKGLGGQLSKSNIIFFPRRNGKPTVMMTFPQVLNSGFVDSLYDVKIAFTEMLACGPLFFRLSFQILSAPFCRHFALCALCLFLPKRSFRCFQRALQMSPSVLRLRELITALRTANVFRSRTSKRWLFHHYIQKELSLFLKRIVITIKKDWLLLKKIVKTLKKVMFYYSQK